jgi:methionyl aminopeptidase
MSVGSEDDLDGICVAGAAAARVLRVMLDAVESGVTPVELNHIGAIEMRGLGARSAPMLSVGFPAETCISVNEAIAHGIPGESPLGDGDLVNIDVSLELDGYFADTGASIPVQPGNPELDRLCAAGRRALERALGEVRPGALFNRIGWAAEETARASGYEIVRDLCGHGVGRSLHEEPREIPGYYDPRDRRRFREGSVLAIEPFVSTGARHVRALEDGWTLVTDDGGLAVQFEHTVVVTPAGALVVTARRPFLIPSGGAELSA